MEKMKDEDKSPMEKCPRFSRCSVPICPLDKDKDKRVYLQGEPVCTLSKSIRIKLGKDLPWKGLKPREEAGIKNWSKMSSDKRSKLTKNLVPGAKFVDLPRV